LRKLENDIKDAQKRVNEKIGVKESDTGLAPPSLWDIPADKQRMGEEQPLQASRPTATFFGQQPYLYFRIVIPEEVKIKTNYCRLTLAISLCSTL
jgi:hypothetical protein